MARLVTSGFEFQTIDTGAAGRAEGQGYWNVGAPAINTSIPRSGAACLKCNTTVQYTKWTGVGGSLDHWFYVRAYLLADGNPTANSRILHLMNGSAAEIGSIGVINAGSGTPPKLRLRDSAGTTVGSDSAVIATNQWLRVEIGAFVPTAGNGKLYFWLDDVLVASSDSVSTTNSAVNEIRLGTISGTPGNSVSYYFDDVAANDDTGASQTSRPGEGRIVLRKPTSGVASGFIGGAGGAAAATAVDNIPPVGVASGSATDTSQIKSGISNTTDNYEATLEAYTASEITSSDLITLIQPVANIGIDTTTAVVGQVSTTANPADGTETGIASLGAVAGTYPSNWITSRGPVLYSPTVTLGSSPKVKIRRGTNNGSVLHVDLVGLYVEYQRRFYGSAVLTGEGALASQGVRVLYGAGAFDGDAALAAAGNRSLFGASVLAGDGVLAGEGSRALYGAGSLAGDGSLTGNGARSLFGASALAGEGALTAAGVRALFDAAVLSGEGALTAAGVRNLLGAAALAGDGSLASDAYRVLFGASALAGEGFLTAVAEGAILYGAAVLSGDSAVSAEAFRAQFGQAALAGEGLLVAAGLRAVYSAAALSGDGVLAAESRKALYGMAGLVGEGLLSAQALKFAYAAAVLAGDGILVASGRKTSGEPTDLFSRRSIVPEPMGGRSITLEPGFRQRSIK